MKGEEMEQTDVGFITLHNERFNSRIVSTFLKILIPASLLLAFLIVAVFYLQYIRVRSIATARNRAEVSLISELVNREVETVVSDLLFIAGSRHFSELYDDVTINTDDLHSDLLEFARRKQCYDQIRYIGIDGKEIIRVNYNDGSPSCVPADQLQGKSDRYYFTKSIELPKGAVFASSFDLNIERGIIERPFKPMLRVATPVFSSDGVKRGIIILNYLGEGILSVIRQSDKNVYGDLALLNMNGYWLYNSDPQKEWGFMFDDRKSITFGASFPEEWDFITSEKEGSSRIDGTELSFARICPLDHIAENLDKTAEICEDRDDWILVAKTTAQQMLSRLDSLRFYLWILFSVLFLISAVVSYIFAVSEDRKRHLREEKERVIRELKDALNQVKTLEDLLPICAVCKKVRDDRGYWHQVENYVSDHTGASFSHGYCPECAEAAMAEILNDHRSTSQDTGNT